MNKFLWIQFLLLYCLIVVFGCSDAGSNNQKRESIKNANDSTGFLADTLPEPYATKSTTNFSKVMGRPEGKTPDAPAGFNVAKFADGLDNPRWIYVADIGDIFVAESNTVSKGIKKKD